MILCHDVIWLSKSSSTYCMRERGHSGEHSPNTNVKEEKEILICEDAFCPFTLLGINHTHDDPKDLTRARVKVNTADTWHGVFGTNG